MSELILRICEDGTVSVEEDEDGIRTFKKITPESLLACIDKSLLRGGISSGLLPRNCLSFIAHDDGSKHVCLLHPESMADITYYGSPYPNLPIPQMIFGFGITSEGSISKCRLGVVGNENHLKPATPLYVYPFSNVSSTNLCIGNNTLPRVKSLHTLSSLPYHILSMDNNNDHFRPSNNKLGLEMRDLLEQLRDKSQEYYYSDILIPSNQTLSDFIASGGS